MSYLNFNKDTHVAASLANMGLKGKYTLVKRRVEDNSISQVLEFDNLITDAGLEKLGTSMPILYFFVGTGTNAPTTADTQMGAFVAYSGMGGVTVPSNPAPTSPNYVSTYNFGCRFGQGVAAGNLTEVGIGWSSSGNPTSGTNRVFSRALIVDGANSPTTLTVASNEYLDVFYTLESYPDLSDVSGSVVISGVTYTTLTRFAAATQNKFGDLNINSHFYPLDSVTAYSGAIGAVTGLPSGTAGYPNSKTGIPYVAGSKEIDTDVTWGLNAGNLAGGIKSIYVTGGPGIQFINPSSQIELTPTIPKDNTKTLTLRLSYSWARH